MKNEQMREWLPYDDGRFRSRWIKYRGPAGSLEWRMYGKRKDGRVVVVGETIPAMGATDLARGVMPRRLVAHRLRKARHTFWEMMRAPR